MPTRDVIMDKPSTARRPLFSILSFAATLLGILVIKFGPTGLGTGIVTLNALSAGWILAGAALIMREQPRSSAAVAMILNLGTVIVLCFH